MDLSTERPQDTLPLDRQRFNSWQRFKLAFSHPHPSSTPSRINHYDPDALDLHNYITAFDTLSIGTSPSVKTLRTSASDGDFFRKLSSRTSTDDPRPTSPRFPSAGYLSPLRHDLILPEDPCTTSPATLPQQQPLPDPSQPTTTKPTGAEQRAVALFSKYGLKVDPSNCCPTTRPSTIERVQRVIRLRVQHHCHECRGSIAVADDQCTRCAHRRCKRCSRSPRFGFRSATRQRGDGNVRPASTELKRRRSPSAEPVERIARASPPGTLRPVAVAAPAAGGASMLERMWKRPRQRLVYSCEACGRHFDDKSSVCAGCGHRRCEQCPREV